MADGVYDVLQFRAGVLVWSGPVQHWWSNSDSPNWRTHSSGRRHPFSSRGADDWQVGDVIALDACGFQGNAVTACTLPSALSARTARISSPPPPTPAPPPPPAPSPPPPCDARCRKDALREAVLESLRSRVSPPSASPRMRAYYADTSSEDEPFIIPRWLTGVLSFVGSIILSCVLRKAIRYVCSGKLCNHEARSQTDPNAISVEMESASLSASVDLPRILTPMSELEREQYVRLFKSLGGCPVGRAAAAPTFERAQLPLDDLDAIWAL